MLAEVADAFLQLASWAITIHMVEIAMWGLFFWWKKCLPAIFFSAALRAPHQSNIII